MSATVLETLLTTEEVAAQLGTRVGLLREWKYLDDKDNGHRGPKATKVGRLVRYKPSDIASWLDAQQVAS
ncbi:helix-turn-helix domain-containing protein [Pseudoclavibacter sp. 8L]|uniref:helix-turn-helix domain-containing protein n=1 Tax=Pseudoclavibacter sp. 8L TaxID=2653162 RepID=UPI0012F0C01A|nr:helix-turn-helix domain-containing protein [Pseudoclavibacter sp. 8L]VXB76547.1 Excisionase [Pseudoclavibacter sp. 8L]